MVLRIIYATFSDISVVLDHFDHRVIQSSYEPYKGFNFFYLFVTSVCLICVSHVVNFIYWAVIRNALPMVNTNNIIQSLNPNFLDLTSKGGEFKDKKRLFRILPYLPTSLPTLLFSRIAELTITLEGNTPVAFEVWEEMVTVHTL